MRAPEIVSAVQSVIGNGPVRLHEPLFVGNERKYLDEALASGQVAYGPFVQRFEDRLCEITGRRFAVATCSGTAALHLAVKVLTEVWPYFRGWFGWRRRITLHSLTFVATANALAYQRWPIKFCDIGRHSVDIGTDILGRVSGQSLWVEDAAPALGSVNRELHPGVGNFRVAGRQGRLAIFSFNGNKICSAGGGGAIVTDEQDVAEYVRHLANQAKSSPTEHDQVGFNYRMPNLNAALGLAQLERLPEFLDRKARLADRYAQVFGDLFWKPPEGSNNWLNALLVRDIEERDAAVAALNEAGYESRALHAPLHTLQMYRDCPRSDMTRTMGIWSRCVCLPSGAGVM